MGTHDRKLWAIDATDGKPCAGFGDGGQVTAVRRGRLWCPGDVSNSSAPVVADGVVVIGSTVIDFVRATTPRGTVKAFDSFSGQPLWQFDPLLGHARQRQRQCLGAHVGGCGHNGLLYLPTSAASPDYYGVDRPGNGLYANSVVALDLHSGELRWHFQHVRHDLWDYDTPAQPILFDWHKNGDDRPRPGPADQAGLRVRLQPPHRRAPVGDYRAAGAALADSRRAQPRPPSPSRSRRPSCSTRS